MHQNQRTTVLDIPFDRVTEQQVLARIFNHLLAASNFHKPREHKLKPLFIATPNPEMLLEAAKNEPFKKVLQSTDINIADGIGILWAATYLASLSNNPSYLERFTTWLQTLFTILFAPKSLTKIIPERLTGVDVMQQICVQLGQSTSLQDIRIFFLGAQPGVAEKTAQTLQKNMGLQSSQIAGTASGSPHSNDEEEMRKLINNAKPDILFVAFGAPKQELWLERNLPYLQTVKVAIGVGGAFDFIAGIRKRAPHWMQKLGIEWLYRVIQQPSRIRRIYNATVKFPIRILLSQR